MSLLFSPRAAWAAAMRGPSAAVHAARRRPTPYGRLRVAAQPGGWLLCAYTYTAFAPRTRASTPALVRQDLAGKWVPLLRVPGVVRQVVLY